jgi:hypothetical protein
MSDPASAKIIERESNAVVLDVIRCKGLVPGLTLQR